MTNSKVKYIIINNRIISIHRELAVVSGHWSSLVKKKRYKIVKENETTISVIDDLNNITTISKEFENLNYNITKSPILPPYL